MADPSARPVDPATRLFAAEASVAAARADLSATLARLQARLDPRTLAREAARDLSAAGSTAARVGADTARRNPATLAGVVAVAGLFLARHRIAALFRRRPRLATGDEPAS